MKIKYFLAVLLTILFLASISCVQAEEAPYYSGTMTVEAQDNDGNLTSFTMPLAFTVDESVMPVVNAAAIMEDEEMPSSVTYGLAGGCGVLLIYCIVQGIVLHRKIRKLEEDRL